MKVYVILIVSVTFLLIGFAAVAHSITEKMRFYDDPDLMEQEILRFIPIGSSIEQAKKIMEKNGFKCEYRENGTFIKERYNESVPGGVRQTIYKNVDRIYCDISKGFFIVERRWQSSIVHENGIVTQVSVSTGLIGP